MHYVLAVYAWDVCRKSCTFPCKMSRHCCPKLTTRQIMYGKKCNIEACLCNYSCNGIEISTAYFECVFVPLRMQHAMSKRRIVICGLPALPCFSTLSHKQQDFRRNVTEHKMDFKKTYSTQCTQLASRLSNITTVTSGHKTIGRENAVWPPDDGCKDARNILRNNWLPIKSLIVASIWSHLYLFTKWVFWCSLQIGWSISHSERNWARCYHNCRYVFV